MNFSESAVKLGRIQVEYQATIGRPEIANKLTIEEKTSELLRMCLRDNVSFKGFEYLELKLIN